MPSNIEEKAHKIDQMPALPNLLKDLGMVSSTSDALRLIQQGAVKINQEKEEDKDTFISKNEKTLLQVLKNK